MTQVLKVVTDEELSYVSDNMLKTEQLNKLLKHTPEKYVKERPAKGGGKWKYVTGGYVKKQLNLMFGWDWDFEIMEQLVMHGEAIVKGRLTCRANGRAIIKMQFGNKDIMYKKQSAEDAAKGLPREPLSIGNDLKAAATDCLKKCAAEIGIAADIYNAEDFNAVEVVSASELDWNALETLFELKKDKVKASEFTDIEKVINGKISKDYNKVKNNLSKL